jgi:hypothetical protein
LDGWLDLLATGDTDRTNRGVKVYLQLISQPHAPLRRCPCCVKVIVIAVRWYLRQLGSYRDVEELLVECGVEVDHVTV